MSRAVPQDEVLSTALAVADKLATGPPARHPVDQARAQPLGADATPIFESSLAFEMLNFLGGDVVEGARALREKRPPVFPVGH